MSKSIQEQMAKWRENNNLPAVAEPAVENDAVVVEPVSNDTGESYVEFTVEAETVVVDSEIDAINGEDGDSDSNEMDSEDGDSNSEMVSWTSILDPGQTIEMTAEEFDSTVDILREIADKKGNQIFDNYSEFEIVEALTSVDSMAELGLVDEEVLDANGNLDFHSSEFWNQYIEILTKNFGIDEKAPVEPSKETVIVATEVAPSENDERDVLGKLSELTDELSAMREQTIMQEITRLLTRVSKIGVTEISDVTVLVAENVMLRKQLITLLAALEVRVQFSNVKQVRGARISDQRQVNYFSSQRLPMKDLTAGVTVGLSYVDNLKEKLAKLAEADARITHLTSQRETQKTEITALQEEKKALELEVSRLNNRVAEDHTTHRGILVRFNVTAKNKAGEKYIKHYYLSVDEEAKGEEKVKVSMYRRTQNLDEALRFPNKQEAQNTINRVLKYAKNIKPESGLKEAHFQNAVLIRNMERVV